MEAAAFIVGCVAGIVFATCVFYIWLVFDTTRLSARQMRSSSKPSKEIKEEWQERACENCKHYKARLSEEPCVSCEDHIVPDKWEAKE